MNITLKSEPLSEVRNRQIGDWTHNTDGSITAISAELENEDYELLVSLHEMLESYLCRKRGITDEQVTAFDKAFEEARLRGDDREAGDSRICPYGREHFFATNIERLVAAELGVCWTEYERVIQQCLDSATPA